MKIAILSMQKVDNIGSLLQSYSLKKILEKEGNTVSFIDIEKNEEDYKLMEKYYTKEKKKIINKIKKIDKYFFNRLKMKKLQKMQNAIYQKFRKEKLNIKDGDNDDEYDLCIIGSDEVFNCVQESKWGFTSQLYGNVRQASNVITYAASCGSTTVDKIPTKVKERIQKYFRNISAFSARDENTKMFIQKLSDKKVEMHLDPVLVGNFDEEMKKVDINKMGLPEHYCIIYSYPNRINSKLEINAIKKYCKDNNLELITIGNPQMWVKNYKILDPFETLEAFKKADLVITDTFHGTIFSAKYSRKFAIMVRESNKNKLDDLINRLNIKEHKISKIEDLEKACMLNNDITSIREVLEKERKNTIKYLEDNVKNSRS